MQTFTIIFNCQNPAYEERAIEEKTHVDAESEDDAWEKFLNDKYASPPNHYTKISVYPRGW